MKKKTNKTYFKSLDIKSLNNDLPIGLNELNGVINNISVKYPLLSKTEITWIVRTFFEEVREQILIGNSVNIQKFLYNMKLYTFCRLRQNKVVINTRVQIATPNEMNDVKK